MSVFSKNPERIRRFVLFAAAFCVCLALSSALAGTLNLPLSMQRVEDESFRNSTSLEIVYIPESVESIGDYAFAGSSLTAVHIPASVRFISETAFDGCSGLTIYAPCGSAGQDFALDHEIPFITELVIGETAEAVVAAEGDVALFSFVPSANGRYRFSSESGADTYGYLYDADMQILMSDDESGPDSNFEIAYDLEAGKQYFYGARYYYTSATGTFSVRLAVTTTWLVTDDVLYIYGSGEMEDYDYNPPWPNTVKRAVIGQDVTTVGSRAFYGCDALEEVEIPDSVTCIRESAFSSCRNLAEIEIPASVTRIGTDAFAYCSLTVRFLGNAPEFDGNIFSQGSVWNGNYAILAIYPHKNKTWNSKTKKNYGADVIIWRADNEPDVLPDTAKDVSEAPDITESNTDGDQDYDTYGRSVCTYLIPEEDGGLTRVEYTGSEVSVEQYSAGGVLTWKKTLPVELQRWGGFYSGANYHFLVFGQNNPNEDDSVEVMRVVRYSKNWHRIDSVSVYGANTTSPFAHGSCRITESGNMLYIHTCHQMYTSSNDGLRHQANMHYDIYIPTMTIVQENFLVSNPGHDYVSHSFNQFVITDGNNVIKVDHGDAYPRSITMLRYQNSADSLGFGSSSRITLLSLAGSVGANYTGASVGGLAASSTHYLVAVNSIDQSGSGGSQRNIYVLAADKENFTDSGVTPVRITDYASSAGKHVSTPVLVKINDGSFLLLWTEDRSNVHYCFLNAAGKRTTGIYVSEGKLSDCQPVVRGKKITWYVTSGSTPVFYTIDVNHPGSISRN